LLSVTSNFRNFRLLLKIPTSTGVNAQRQEEGVDPFASAHTTQKTTIDLLINTRGASFDTDRWRDLGFLALAWDLGLGGSFLSLFVHAASKN